MSSNIDSLPDNTVLNIVKEKFRHNENVISVSIEIIIAIDSHSALDKGKIV